MNFELLFGTSTHESSDVALIGVSEFARSLLIYGTRNRFVTFRVLCDHDGAKCVAALRDAGVPEDLIVHCDSHAVGVAALEGGRYAVFEDAELAAAMPVEVVVETTGSPEGSCRAVLSAIENGTHVVAVSKESDSVVGPLLARKARERGVIYSLSDGDQPALLLGLLSWAETAGLTVVSAGKASEYDFVYDRSEGHVRFMDRVVEMGALEAEWHLPVDLDAKRETLNRRAGLLAECEQRAVPDLAETAIVCNHRSDLLPDIESLHFPIARTTEIPDIMCPPDRSGILAGPNRIDVVHCLRTPDSPSLGGGVYLVVACDDEETWRVLEGKGIPLGRNRECALVYYPAHYLGLEALFSVLSVVRLGVPTSSLDPRPRYDLVAKASRTLPAGTRLIAEGHHHVIDGLDGYLLPAAPVKPNGRVPYYLADGTVLKRDIAEGEYLTADMLDPPADSVIWRLRGEQDRCSWFA